MEVKKTHVESSDSEENEEIDDVPSESDVGADPSSSDGESNEDQTVTKHGLADAMAKILKKQIPVNKQVILSKGKTDREIKKRKIESTEDKDDIKIKKEVDDDKLGGFAAVEKKKLWEEMGRVKPDPLERDAERKLQRIAQRGVVQLFNAVRSQQKVIEEKLSSAGPTESKKARAMEKMTKGKFLDLLKGTTVNVGKEEPKVEIKEEEIDEESDKRWSILRDDFMMGAQMKDWDKDDSDDDNNTPQQPQSIEESSDSDNG